MSDAHTAPSLRVVILGGGPAGLTSAYTLAQGHDVTVLEMEGQVGGISRTVVHKGNRMDIGGHRFFSKSSTVMRWWQNILPLQGAPACDDVALGRVLPLSSLPDAPDPEQEDKVMLLRSRLSRIVYLRKFFNYPITLNLNTISNLGFVRLARMGLGYLVACVWPIKDERSLEEYLVNRFGRELYKTFFRDYTYKVWGVACDRIPAAWGAQRIKGLSVRKVLLHAIRQIWRQDTSVDQKKTETSLIEQFCYPKLGPGQLWEEVARLVEEKGGKVALQHQVIGLSMTNTAVTAVRVRDLVTGSEQELPCDVVISSLPLRELVAMLPAPERVRETAAHLQYRDFMTVGILLDSLPPTLRSPGQEIPLGIRDNWLYVQEPDVKLGRIQIFNNWSPYLVADPTKIWLGLEYFVNEGDESWQSSDEDFSQMAVAELCKLGFATPEAVLDSVVLRVKKAYPAYFGTAYQHIDQVQDYLDSVSNLYPVGRNGMHRYNNMDHSMLSAMHAAACIEDSSLDKRQIWAVNSEQEYHEEGAANDG